MKISVGVVLSLAIATAAAPYGQEMQDAKQCESMQVSENAGMAMAPDMKNIDMDGMDKSARDMSAEMKDMDMENMRNKATRSTSSAMKDMDMGREINKDINSMGKSSRGMLSDMKDVKMMDAEAKTNVANGMSTDMKGMDMETTEKSTRDMSAGAKDTSMDMKDMDMSKRAMSANMKDMDMDNVNSKDTEMNDMKDMVIEKMDKTTRGMSADMAMADGMAMAMLEGTRTSAADPSATSAEPCLKSCLDKDGSCPDSTWVLQQKGSCYVCCRK